MAHLAFRLLSRQKGVLQQTRCASFSRPVPVSSAHPFTTCSIPESRILVLLTGINQENPFWVYPHSASHCPAFKLEQEESVREQVTRTPLCHLARPFLHQCNEISHSPPESPGLQSRRPWPRLNARISGSAEGIPAVKPDIEALWTCRKSPCQNPPEGVTSLPRQVVSSNAGANLASPCQQPPGFVGSMEQQACSWNGRGLLTRQSRTCFTSGWGSQSQARAYSSESGMSNAAPGGAEGEPRERMEYDVVIVGAGPAGLAAAIRLKQLCQGGGQDLSVCIVEKGAEVGAHILSGNVFETKALDELLPDWRSLEAPIHVPVTKDRFLFLTETRALPLPSPFSNHNNFVISLSELVRWMGAQAEQLGVEIYPGFAASEVLYGEEGAGAGGAPQSTVVGIATNDVGVAKDGSRKDSFARGMELRGRVTLLAEGCRGSLSEVWEVEEGKHRAGEVVHTLGYPLNSHTYGGGFLYHMAHNQVRWAGGQAGCSS
eukprot:jgi/Mesen1/8728/ME000052S08155